MRNARLSMFIVVATLVVAVTLIGCGGGGSSPTAPKPVGTPTPTPVPVTPMITLVASTPASGATVSARDGLVVRVHYVTSGISASVVMFAVITASGTRYAMGSGGGVVEPGSGFIDVSATGTPDMPGVTTTQIQALLY